jgi:hypothetical protein
MLRYYDHIMKKPSVCRSPCLRSRHASCLSAALGRLELVLVHNTVVGIDRTYACCCWYRGNYGVDDVQ